LSPPDHYVEEAATVWELYSELAPGGIARPRLLELGAGGGHLLAHLVQRFDCTATDVSEPMLENCARLVPEARRIQGDMRALRLNESFDVVLMADAIDYMRSADDVRAALATAAAHLAPGGVVVVAPTYTRDSFVDGDVADDANASAGLTYFSYVHASNAEATEYELILLYLIADAQSHAVNVIEDRHHCGLFSVSEWQALLAGAGFDANFIEDDKAWALFGGTKRR
jgi:SAM-dependent methyltransferase